MATAIDTLGRRRQRLHRNLTLNHSRLAKQWDDQLAWRMLQAAEGFTWKQIADLTRDHPENVRRHMNNGRVTARFLAHFCEALELEPRWLLLGKGPMRRNGKRR